MKKLLIIAAVAAATLASCSENVIIPNTSKQNAISFDVYADRVPSTKGLVTTAGDVPAEGTTATYTTIREDGFLMNAVLGDDAKPNFMYNQSVTYNATDGKWEYNPIKYWPADNTQTIDFYAWAPNGAATPAADNAKALGFTLNTDPSAMVDLVATCAIDQHGQAVDFKFKHVLTRLNFSAISGTPNGPAFVIESASILHEVDSKVNEIYTAGTYSFGATTEAAGSWTEVTAPISADMPLAAIWSAEGQTLGNKSGKEFNTEGWPVALSPATPAASPLFADNQYMFLLPVDGTGTAADKTYVEFKYHVVTVDDSLTEGYSVSTATKKVALPDGILQQGVAYNVCFKFTVEAITIGDVSVDPWFPEDGAETGGSAEVK